MIAAAAARTRSLLGCLLLAVTAVPAAAQVPEAPDPAAGLKAEVRGLRVVVRRLRDQQQQIHAALERTRAAAAAEQRERRALLRSLQQRERRLDWWLGGLTALTLAALVLAAAGLRRRSPAPAAAPERPHVDPLRERILTAEARLRTLEKETGTGGGERSH